MATQAQINQLEQIKKEIEDINTDELYRKSLGVESLESVLEPKLQFIKKKLDFIVEFIPNVHHDHIAPLLSPFANLKNTLATHAKRSNTDYVAQKITFLTSLDSLTSDLLRFWPPIIATAVEAKGLLEDGGIQREYKHTIESIKEESNIALELVKKESNKTIEVAKKLAQQIEDRARRTAAHISVEVAQEQFRLGQKHHFWQVIVWACLSVVGIIGFICLAWHFYYEPILTDAQLADDKFTEKIKWIVFYKSVIRIAILAAVGAIATFCLKILRAHMHMFQHNLHRQRVTNSMAAFVESAITPEQRDLILTHLVDAVASFGNSGLLQKEDDTIHSPTMTIDTIARTFSSGQQK
jgi:hypothetical protein